MSATITTYAEYVAAQRDLDDVAAEMRRLQDDDDRRDEYVAAIDRWNRQNDRVYRDPPEVELLRIMWIVDHWDRTTVPPELDEDGEIESSAHNDERGEAVTTAHEVRWLVEALVAEVRRLRPELAAPPDES